MSLNEEQFRHAMDVTMDRFIQSMIDIVAGANTEAEFMEMSRQIQVPNFSKQAWELSRPETVCIEHDVTDRVRELHGGVDLGEFVGFYLTEIIAPDGRPCIVYGWGRHKDGSRQTGSIDREMFGHVQKALDEKIIEADVRDPDNGELLVSDSPHNLNKQVEHRLSDVVVKDIDAQVEKFSSELDSIFGDSPDPGWSPPTPPGGG